MPREGVGMCTIVVQATVLWSYTPNVLCSALQVAAKVPMYYTQCCKKLQCSIVMHSTIVVSSPHVCCAVEHSVACCAKCCTAITTLTLPHTRLVAHQSTQLQPNTPIYSLTLRGLVYAPGHTQGITDRTVGGLATC